MKRCDDMPRADLLALTIDDLAALTNRGTVKRAQRELDEIVVTGNVIEANDGTLTATWSDGVTCRIEAGKTLSDGHCDCPAIGLCRHLLRCVLAYQTMQTDIELSINDNAMSVSDNALSATWNPGDISDDALSQHYRPQAFQRIRTTFNAGVLGELVRSDKPTAYLIQPPAVVRFLVPGDPRYTHCDCADPAPCSHVPIAVWAFRELNANETVGIVSTGGKTPPVESALLDEIDAVFAELVELGLSAVPKAWVNRLTRLESRCRDAALIWPAEVVAQIIEERCRYAEQNALFDIEAIPTLIGELLARRDAIANDTGEFPQLLIRGTNRDSGATLGKCRLVGLGCGVHLSAHAAELTAYLLDTDTGTVGVISKRFANPTDTALSPKAFADLGRASAVKSIPFAELGRGQLLYEGGRRSANFRITLGRAPASNQAQTFQWNELPPPVAVNEYAELSRRIASLPPSALRPRRAAEDFHVLTVNAVSQAGFDVIGQRIVAELRDGNEQSILLDFPFTGRGESGVERLLCFLLNENATLKYVAGTVRRSRGGLTIQPKACMFQTKKGPVCVQPWIDPHDQATKTTSLPHANEAERHPLADVLYSLQERLQELLLLGLSRSDPTSVRHWQSLLQQAESVGLTRFSDPIGRVANGLEERSRNLNWESGPTTAAVLHLCVLVRLANDLAV